jgi:hypothetical protein
MVAYADGKPLPGLGNHAERAVVNRQKLSRVLEESRTPRREFHIPRRSLNEPEAEPVLESLEFQADGGLSGLQGFSRTREAAEFGNANEGFHGI